MLDILLRLLRSKKNLWVANTLFLFLYFCYPNNSVFSAVVSSVTQDSGVGFGLINPLTGGQIKTSTSCATSSGAAKTIGTNSTFPCINGSFTVSGTNNSSGGSRNRITVIIPSSVIISSGGGSMTVNLSLVSNGNRTKQTYNLSGSSGGPGTVSVPVYGTIVVSSGQVEGDYSGAYTFMACDNSITSC